MHARARANELRDGDKNTKYFHHKANQREKQNYVKGLTNVYRSCKTGKAEMQSIVADYFEELFSTENLVDAENAL